MLQGLLPTAQSSASRMWIHQNIWRKTLSLLFVVVVVCILSIEKHREKNFGKNYWLGKNITRQNYYYYRQKFFSRVKINELKKTKTYQYMCNYPVTSSTLYCIHIEIHQVYLYISGDSCGGLTHIHPHLYKRKNIISREVWTYVGIVVLQKSLWFTKFLERC